MLYLTFQGDDPEKSHRYNEENESARQEWMFRLVFARLTRDPCHRHSIFHREEPARRYGLFITLSPISAAHNIDLELVTRQTLACSLVKNHLAVLPPPGDAF
jgi:hypothetical protein